MKELLSLIVKLDFKGLFFRETSNGLIQFFRYAFVGGISFIVDTLLYELVVIPFGDKNILIWIGTTLGFLGGIITNFILSKKFVFTQQANTKSQKGEFLAYVIIGIIGYFLTVGLTFLFTRKLGVIAALSKPIASVIVLFYNYIARKKLLYTKKS